VRHLGGTARGGRYKAKKDDKAVTLNSFWPILEKTQDLKVADWFSLAVFVGKVAGESEGP
jgi:hypothetical protein